MRLRMIGAGIGIAFGVLIAFVILGFAVSGGTNQTGAPGTNTIQANSGTIAKMNEIIMISGITYNVTEVNVRDSYPYAGLLGRSDGGMYVAVEILVKNEEKEEKPELDASDFTLTDSTARQYHSVLYAAGDRQAISELQSGLSGTRFAFFLVAFEPSLDYKMSIKDRTIDLGSGISFSS